MPARDWRSARTVDHMGTVAAMLWSCALLVSGAVSRESMCPDAVWQGAWVGSRSVITCYLAVLLIAGGAVNCCWGTGEGEGSFIKSKGNGFKVDPGVMGDST